MCLIFGCKLWPKVSGKLQLEWKTPGFFFFQKSGNPIYCISWWYHFTVSVIIDIWWAHFYLQCWKSLPFSVVTLLIESNKKGTDQAGNTCFIYLQRFGFYGPYSSWSNFLKSLIGPIPWGHSGPLSRIVVVDIARRLCYSYSWRATSDTWWLAM